MLHIDATFEDSRMVLDYSEETKGWKGMMYDNLTGKELEVEMNPKEATAILAFNLDGNGEPEFEGMYEILAPWLKRYGMLAGGENVRFRPIP